MKKVLPWGLAFVVGVALSALGQEGGKVAKSAPSGGLHLTIKTLDTDADGGVSKEEWMAVFTKLNANGDAALSEAELNAGSPLYPCPGAAGVARKKAGGK